MCSQRRKLGNGSFAHTYYIEESGLAYTVKQYKKEISDNHFNNEIGVLTLLLNHSDGISVPRLHRIDALNRHITYNYVDGVHLDKVAYRLETLTQLLRQLLTTLSSLHRLGIYHRDVKPSNILYSDATSTFTLIDFGQLTIHTVLLLLTIVLCWR